MKLQYAAFLLPVHPASDEEEELNRFIRGRRLVQVRRELVLLDGVPHWALLVEYLEGGAAESGGKGRGDTGKNRVDYREILSPEDFSLFSKLRELRKRLAEEGGLPVYAVCTNEQLAEIARRRPKTLADCTRIEGIGQGKAEKYVPAFLACIAGEGGGNRPAEPEQRDEAAGTF